MTRYSGTKSLDAEIIVDLVRGEVQMDYSLNRFGNPFSSNRSVTLYNEWRKAPSLQRLKYALLLELLLFASPAVLVLMLSYTFLTQKQLITNPEWQYKFQKFMKWYFENKGGIYKQTYIGSLDGVILKFTIPENIWVEYELKGEYKEQIRAISLLRNFIEISLHGKFAVEKQQGWNVVFEFKKPPRFGSCTIRYV